MKRSHHYLMLVVMLALTLGGCAGVAQAPSSEFAITESFLKDTQFLAAYHAAPELVDRMIRTIAQQEQKIQILSRK